ncbi:MAG: hypothetical protein JXB45_05465 [Candidatus Krumholzibacteriota bacterium]|nr:hypothetical protein [Candidatus Krumholzibacteriota bacterium]
MTELLLFFEAFLVSFLLTGTILRFSLKRSLLDIPNDRSSHIIPKPRLGGAAIVFSFYLSALTLYLTGARPFQGSSAGIGIFSAGILISLVGLIDDLRGLRALLKLLLQVAAAGIAVLCGVILRRLDIPLVGEIELGALAVPFTFLWIIGIINFYNFIDGIDGLAAGVGMIGSIFLALIGLLSGSSPLAGLYVIMAGAMFGFLRYNFPPARIFMGDLGSTFIGFLFAVFSIMGVRQGVPAFVTVLLLSAVIVDAALTLIRRIIQREKIFSAHRTHYYQRLISLGLSHKQVTLLEYLVTALLGISALLLFSSDRVFITSFAVIWLGFFLWAIVKIRSMERGGRLFWEGKTLALALGDLVFIAASYFLSYYLRLNFSFPEMETASLLISFPVVLVVRTAVFFYYGLYRTVWKYTTFDDLMRVVKAVTLGSAVMVVLFTFLFRFEAFPRSVFIIDWFILTVFLAGSRIATRWFHELPSHEEVTGKRVVIGETGHLAEVILHQVKQAKGMLPVGFLDDRHEMAGKMIHGLKVLGSFSEVERISRRFNLDEILLMSSYVDRLPPGRIDEARGAGVSIRIITDPSEVELGSPGETADNLYAGRKVVVAGGGPLIQNAGSIFAGATELVLISDEMGALGDHYRRDQGERRERISYLGLLDNRQALGSVLEKHAPDYVFADFSFPGNTVSNAVYGYIKKVILPLERLARETLSQSPARMIIALTEFAPGDTLLLRASAAAELVIRDIYREHPGRLLVLRKDREASPEWWKKMVREIETLGGGVFRARTRKGARSGFYMERMEASPLPPDIRSNFLELARLIDEGAGEGPIGEMLDLFRPLQKVEKYD